MVPQNACRLPLPSIPYQPSPNLMFVSIIMFALAPLVSYCRKEVLFSSHVGLRRMRNKEQNIMSATIHAISERPLVDWKLMNPYIPSIILHRKSWFTNNVWRLL
jgi:hypothetical protein